MEEMMDVEDFGRRISMIKTPTPKADAYDLKWGQREDRWWTGQREHLSVWCMYQPTEGTQDYPHKPNHSAKKMYMYFGQPETLLWLAEAVEIDKDLLDRVIARISNDSPVRTKCGMLRKMIPFEMIKDKLLERKKYGE